MRADIALLPGDGIGPEVTAEAVKVLRSAAVWKDVAHTLLNTKEFILTH
jgi:isocitrate/isopropylmalate dehydrogenase